MEKQLSGHIAIVTGSDSGIGKATAIAFAREGAKVVITVHSDEQGAENTAEQIRANGGEAMISRLDQTDAASVARLFDEVERHFGAPTLLVNNAGIDSSGKPVKDMTPEEWDKEIRTNLHGPFYCCREFIRRLNGQHDQATIINVTSVHEEIPRAGASAYCAAKAGLRNLTRCLALELAQSNISVKNIAPGMVLTPFNQEAVDNPSVREEQVQSIPQKRAAEPEEIAEVAVFLASGRADYIHGSTIFVDGGLIQNVGQGA